MNTTITGFVTNDQDLNSMGGVKQDFYLSVVGDFVVLESNGVEIN